jgi:hypothetical protein
VIIPSTLKEAQAEIIELRELLAVQHRRIVELQQLVERQRLIIRSNRISEKLNAKQNT